LSELFQNFFALTEAWHVISLFLTTFVLEDAALVMGIALVKSSSLSFVKAFLAIFCGIVLGDIGLYLAGALARKLQKKNWPRLETLRQQIRDSKRADVLMVVSRAVPGSRLPLYLAAGYFGYSLKRFVLVTIASVFVWVAFAFSLGQGIAEFWTGPLWSLLVVFVSSIFVVRQLLPQLADPWKRKALLCSWRKWTHFEFWPAWLFYLPVVFYIPYLALKYRSLSIPLDANPDLRNGGLIGESKWDYLKFVQSTSPWALKAVPIDAESDWQSLLVNSGLQYPVIFKPDVGQRGYGVRLIPNEDEARAYLSHIKTTVIAQEYSDWNVEVGIFYHRYPDQVAGTIPSLTRKEFPFVVGDGKTKLGALILKDKRARIIAATYFARFEKELDRVPSSGERVPLGLSGNHCQGAIFWDGQDLITDEILRSIDRLAHEIPNFYFGRIDVRARSLDDLKVGKNFVVIEINGSGSEMTHIWDAKNSLISAYKTLFYQWNLLFQTGYRVRLKGIASKKKRLRDLAADIKIHFKKNKNLTIAS
jgi:membrane protein DedA with SNARE-associated domain